MNIAVVGHYVVYGHLEISNCKAQFVQHSLTAARLTLGTRQDRTLFNASHIL